jgi:hypothetical protein
MAGEYLTMAEIEAKYPNEWVLIDKPTVSKYDRVAGGRLVCHSPDRDEINRAALALPRPVEIAVFYNGPPIDDDEEAIL